MRIHSNEKNVKHIGACVSANIPVLLIGETGTGKTTIVKELASKNKKELIRINLNGHTGREELLGKYLLENGETKWQDGPLLHAIKNGHWLLLDEINAALPEVLFILQALTESNSGKLGKILLAEKDGEYVEPHVETRIFGTANPSDKYIGTKDFNPATLSRWVVFNIEHLGEEEEFNLLTEAYPGVSKKDIKKLTLSALAARKSKKEEKHDFFMSTRDLVYCTALLEKGIDVNDAFEVAVINKITDEDDRKIVKADVKAWICMSDTEASKYVNRVQELEKEVEKLKNEGKEVEKFKTENEEMQKIVKGYEEKLKEYATFKALIGTLKSTLAVAEDDKMKVTTVPLTAHAGIPPTGKTFHVTGRFPKNTQAEVEQYIIQNGGTIKDVYRVNTVDILVVGDSGFAPAKVAKHEAQKKKIVRGLSELNSELIHF